MKPLINCFKLFCLFVLFCINTAWSQQYRQVKQNCFYPGEKIVYKVHYGFVYAAEGEMVVSKDDYIINDRECYKVDVYGKSIGMFDLFLRIRDNWGTYLDKSAIVTQKFYREIEEGKYRKSEIVDFDQSKGKAKQRTFDKKKQKWRSPKVFNVPVNVQDMVSGYYYLRVLDFDKFSKGDVFSIDAFFDEELYDFKIRYLGKEEIKTKLGKEMAIILAPIMPENSLFDGEDSIKVWLSDDEKKVPLKIKAEMFVGAVEIDIVSYDRGASVK